MAMQVRVQGGRDLTSVRRHLRQVGDREMSRRMGQALSRAAKPLKPAVQAEAVKLLPSGYGPLMSKSLRMRTTTRERRGAASLTITIYGAGKQEHRDVTRVNKGVLRHPVYGRRRNPWVSQKVRRGFVDRPVDRLAPEVAREMHAVVDWVADQIKRG